MEMSLGRPAELRVYAREGAASKSWRGATNSFSYLRPSCRELDVDGQAALTFTLENEVVPTGT